MRLQQLTPRVYQLPFAQDCDRPCLGYIRGDRFSLMVDAGNSPAQVQDYMDALHEEKFPMPQFAALTHSHWDHCFGMCALPIPTIACEETRKSLEIVSQLQWTPAALEENIRKGIVPEVCVPRLRVQYPNLEAIRVALPTIIFSGSMQLDLGNCTCILQHVTSAHAKDTVIVYVPTEKMVFLGDAVYQKPVGDGWVEEKDKLEQLIRELEPLEFALAQPAHQPAMSKQDLLAWFHRRLQKVSLK